jgi:hypothetical protein
MLGWALMASAVTVGWRQRAVVSTLAVDKVRVVTAGTGARPLSPIQLLLAVTWPSRMPLDRLSNERRPFVVRLSNRRRLMVVRERWRMIVSSRSAILIGQVMIVR